jgi:TRAP transporter 4TM/12TM fusion protein
MLEEEEQHSRKNNSIEKLSSFWISVISCIAVLMCIFHLYTSAFGVLESFMQRSIHLMFVLVLVYLTSPLIKNRTKGTSVPFYDLVACVISIITLSYIILNHDSILIHEPYVTELTKSQIIFGGLLVLVLLEATRRVVGLPLVILCILFIIYAFVSPHLPSVIATRSPSVEKLIDHLYLTREGIFGIVLGVSATYVFIFILLASFLRRIGLIDFFSQIALAVAGSSKGGVAKVAVIASALFGTISGSAIGNAVTTGNLTIPMMKRSGFSPHMAAGVESAASMGGQIMPPIMGAAAFIMAEVLSINYTVVVLAALIPAVLYFLAIGLMIHFYALKANIELIPKEKLPKLLVILEKRGYLLIPLGILIFFLAAGSSPLKAGFWCLISCIAVSFFRRESFLTPKKLLDALSEGARNSLVVGVACGVVGIIVGVVGITGMGLKIVGVILYLGSGKLILTLFFTMLAALVIGTGLPTTPSYIITALLIAPALTRFGVPALAAHMFVFWYAILSDLTPPTAIAPFATAALAEANYLKTQFSAFSLALSGFIVPYIFCYRPSLLFIKTHPWDLIISLGGCFIGITMLSAGLVGYLIKELNIYERGILIFGGFLLIVPGIASDLMGLFILVGMIISQKLITS